MQFSLSIECAKELDANDSLAGYRDHFHFPSINGKPTLYFTGNSLGLQPKNTREFVLRELDDWQHLGVEGHIHSSTPWWNYHTTLTHSLANLVGAQNNEVVAMNSLSVNIHLMLATFYKPTAKRNKIIILGHEFSSDRYAVESQIRLHGFNPNDCMIELHPRDGEFTLRTEDILETISLHKDSLAVVHLSAVHFYTGQRFKLQEIAAHAHSCGAVVGYDLAHAIGNVELELHAWNVDYAVWCSYKYLNSGPGAVGGAFVHEKHCTNPDLVRLAGWWGNNEKTRFHMAHRFQPELSAESWQLSNEPILSMAALRASLVHFDAAGCNALFAKRDKLTAYAEYLLTEIFTKHGKGISIITPKNITERGAQLSIHIPEGGKELYDALIARNVIVDFRNPSVIRLAPAPLYNSFNDVYLVAKEFSSILGVSW